MSWKWTRRGSAYRVDLVSPFTRLVRDGWCFLVLFVSFCLPCFSRSLTFPFDLVVHCFRRCCPLKKKQFPCPRIHLLCHSERFLNAMRSKTEPFYVGTIFFSFCGTRIPLGNLLARLPCSASWARKMHCVARCKSSNLNVR